MCFCFFVQRNEESVCLCHKWTQDARSVTRACRDMKRSLFVCVTSCVCGLLKVTSVSHYVNIVFAFSSLLFSYSHECNMLCLLLYKRFIHEAFESEILLLTNYERINRCFFSFSLKVSFFTKFFSPKVSP